MKELFNGSMPGTVEGREHLKNKMQEWFTKSTRLSFIERAAIASEIINSLTERAAECRKKAFLREILPDADLRDYVRLNEDGQPYDSSKFGKEFGYTDKNGRKFYVQVLQKHPKVNDKLVDMITEKYTYDNLPAKTRDEAKDPFKKDDVLYRDYPDLLECASELLSREGVYETLDDITRLEEKLNARMEELGRHANAVRLAYHLPEQIYQHGESIKIVVK